MPTLQSDEVKRPSSTGAWLATEWNTAPTSRPSRRPIHELLIVAVLFLWNLGANLLVPDAGAFSIAITGVAFLLLLAFRAGATWDSMGLAGAAVPRGLKLGITAFAVIGVTVAAASLLPPVRDLLADGRFVGVPTGEMLTETLLRIPVATALGEELAFRGVLLGVLLAWLSPLRAVIISSALFGLWHVLPGVDALESSGAADSTSSLLVAGIAVIGQVAATAVAGMAFAWLRLRSGSIIAPALAHWGINGCAYLAGWLIVRNSWA